MNDKSRERKHSVKVDKEGEGESKERKQSEKVVTKVYKKVEQ